MAAGSVLVYLLRRYWISDVCIILDPKEECQLLSISAGLLSFLFMLFRTMTEIGAGV